MGNWIHVLHGAGALRQFWQWENSNEPCFLKSWLLHHLTLLHATLRTNRSASEVNCATAWRTTGEFEWWDGNTPYLGLECSLEWAKGARRRDHGRNTWYSWRIGVKQLKQRKRGEHKCVWATKQGQAAERDSESIPAETGKWYMEERWRCDPAATMLVKAVNGMFTNVMMFTSELKSSSKIIQPATWPLHWAIAAEAFVVQWLVFKLDGDFEGFAEDFKRKGRAWPTGHRTLLFEWETNLHKL